MRHPVVQRMFDDMWSIDTMRSALVAQLRAHGKALRDDRVETLTRILNEEVTRIRPQFEVLMTDAVLETYTLDEIRALNGFLDTELGARAMAKTGRTMRSFNARAAPMYRRLTERIGARVKAELAE